MGYTTDFEGVLKLNKKLSEEDYQFLIKLNNSRRMKIHADAKYGVDGEFYVEESSMFGEHSDKKVKVLNINEPPSTQPGLWCQWIPTDDYEGLEWDSNEKAYCMEDWIFYIINRYLAPRGYVVNGLVNAYGEEPGDIWAIRVEDNVVRIAHSTGMGKMTDWEKTDWEEKKKIPMTVTTVPPKKKKPVATETKIKINMIRNRKDGEVYLKRSDICKYIDAQNKEFKDEPIMKATLKLFKERIMEL
jgi:hypothetical protein